MKFKKLAHEVLPRSDPVGQGCRRGQNCPVEQTAITQTLRSVLLIIEYFSVVDHPCDHKFFQLGEEHMCQHKSNRPSIEKVSLNLIELVECKGAEVPFTCHCWKFVDQFDLKWAVIALTIEVSYSEKCVQGALSLRLKVLDELDQVLWLRGWT